MNRLAALLIIYSLFLANSNAEGFDTFGNTDRIEGLTVIAAGNISERTRIASNPGSSFESQWRKTMYQLKQYCFESESGLSGKAGLLLTDAYKNSYIAIFSYQISSIKLQIDPISINDCNILTQKDLQKSFDETRRQLELLKIQREAYEKILKNQKNPQTIR